MEYTRRMNILFYGVVGSLLLILASIAVSATEDNKLRARIEKLEQRDRK